MLTASMRSAFNGSERSGAANGTRTVERCVGKRLERGEPEQGIGIAQALCKMSASPRWLSEALSWANAVARTMAGWLASAAIAQQLCLRIDRTRIFGGKRRGETLIALRLMSIPLVHLRLPPSARRDLCDSHCRRLACRI